MTIDEQKDLFKTAITKFIPILHQERKDAFDFADKFIDAAEAFNKLSPDVQVKVTKAFVSITAATYPLQVNPNYKRF